MGGCIGAGVFVDHHVGTGYADPAGSLLRGPLAVFIGGVLGGAFAVPLIYLTPIVLPMWVLTGAIWATNVGDKREERDVDGPV